MSFNGMVEERGWLAGWRDWHNVSLVFLRFLHLWSLAFNIYISVHEGALIYFFTFPIFTLVSMRVP